MEDCYHLMIDKLSGLMGLPLLLLLRQRKFVS